MNKFTKSLVALIGIFTLGIGVSNATPSASDCGDDDVQPINVSQAANAVKKYI